LSPPRRESIEVPGLGHKAPIPAASRIGPFVATGNVYGRDPATGRISDDPDAQVTQMFANLEAVLAAAGGTVDDLLKVDFKVASLSLRAGINEAWLGLFPHPRSRPARSVSQYDYFTPPALVHCDALAVIGDR
jgi:enamine deaminase RidA (YjgF/YER057c/UK114 family)